jgi:hypothetical protein
MDRLCNANTINNTNAASHSGWRDGRRGPTALHARSGRLNLELSAHAIMDIFRIVLQ